MVTLWYHIRYFNTILDTNRAVNYNSDEATACRTKLRRVPVKSGRARYGEFRIANESSHPPSLRDLALVSLIFFFLWRNGEPVGQIGWTFRNGWKDVALGSGLFIPFSVGADLLEQALRAAGLTAPSIPLPSFEMARGLVELMLASVMVVVVALAEETIFRVYLILRFRGIGLSAVAAAVLSAAIFPLGHGYEGSAGVVTVGVMGLVFALIYMWRRSLVAPAVIHFLQDFIAVVLVPLLRIH
ncbi:MAG: CPBP family intramembrane metalloprotease [Armatimonadetes bacterium]|nr:CPBP family intramembrane metalloprotease [Armatimonadota bacterium]